MGPTTQMIMNTSAMMVEILHLVRPSSFLTARDETTGATWFCRGGGCISGAGGLKEGVDNTRVSVQVVDLGSKLAEAPDSKQVEALDSKQVEAPDSRLEVEGSDWNLVQVEDLD